MAESAMLCQANTQDNQKPHLAVGLLVSIQKLLRYQLFNNFGNSTGSDSVTTFADSEANTF